MTHLATIRTTAGLGNSAVYVRMRNAAGQYWNWSTLAWSASEVTACKAYLTEQDDSDAVNSRYSATVALSADTADRVLEYVLASDSTVLGEQFIEAGGWADPLSGVTTLLASVDDVKAYLTQTSATDDVLLASLLAAASKWFATQTSRNILTATYPETRDGDASRILVLREWPVQSVASVVVDGETIPQGTAWDIDGWVVDGRILHLRGNYRFTEGVGNVVVTYDAGYAAVPADVAQAVIELTALKYRERQHVGTSAQTLAGQSATYLPAFVPRSVQDVIESYRRVL